MFILAG